MEKIELADLLEGYPGLDEELFQTKISSKYEFHRLSAKRYEDIPDVGQFYKHQILLHQLAKTYDKFFLIHEPGTGKTCSAVGILEEFLDGPTRREHSRAIVLVSGPTQVGEFKRQLTEVCAPGKYINKDYGGGWSGKQQGLGKAINNRYIIKTYGTFANTILAMSDNEIRETYSDCAFFIDEVHLMCPSSKAKASDYEERRQKIIENKSKSSDDKQTTIVPTKIITYSAIWRALMLVERCKVILASATPIASVPDDIKVSLNLLLEPGEQLYTRFTKGVWDQFVESNTLLADLDEPKGVDLMSDDERVYKILRAKISYIRQPMGAALPVFEGVSVPQGQLPPGEHFHKDKNGKIQPPITLFPTEMIPPDEEGEGGIQMTTYLDFVNIPNHSIEDKAFYNKSFAYSSFVYPDGTTGTEGADKYFHLVGLTKSRKPSKSTNKDENIKFVESGFSGFSFKNNDLRDLMTWESGYYGDELNSLSQLSAKVHAIIQSILIPFGRTIDYEYESEKFIARGGSRKRYIYASFNYHVALPIMAALEANDYERFTGEEQNAFIREGDLGETQISKNFRERKRYAFINSDIQAQAQARILKMFNSPYNIMGEYLEIIIISKVGKFGINLDSVVHVDLVHPEWTWPDIYQAIYRPIRSTSHIQYGKQLQEHNHNSIIKLREMWNMEMELAFISSVYAKIDDESEANAIILERSNIDVNKIDDLANKLENWKNERFVEEPSEEECLEFIEEYRRNLRELDAWKKENEEGDPQVKVFIRIHATYLPKDDDDEDGMLGEPTTDEYAYLHAMKNSYENMRMMAVLKRHAIDCQLHTERNMPPNAVDYSYQCDFGKCNEPCAEAVSDIIDYSTYELYYTDEIIKRWQYLVLDFFMNNGSGTFESIVKYANVNTNMQESERMPRYILYILERLISEKIEIFDRYGFKTTIKEEGGMYFTSSSSLTGYYNRNLVAVEFSSTKDYIMGYMPYKEDESVSLEIYNWSVIKSLSHRDKVKYLRRVVEYVVHNGNSEETDKVLEFYEGNLLITEDAYGELTYVDCMGIPDPKNTLRGYLAGYLLTDTKAKNIPPLKSMYIYNKSSPKWRNPSKEDFAQYLKILRETRQFRYNEISTNDIYGMWHDWKGIFWVKDNIKGGGGKGSQCGTTPIKDSNNIAEALFDHGRPYLRYDSSGAWLSDIPESSNKIEDLDEYINYWAENLSAISTKTGKITKMCEILRSYLYATDRMYLLAPMDEIALKAAFEIPYRKT